MFKRKGITAALVASLMMAPVVGCESLPGGEKEQGAVIGGLGGAAAGAAVSSENRALGALIGGLLGAGGGWLVGTQIEKANDDDATDEAREAARNARENPATAADVRKSDTADLNNDGFVTLDEVVAMEEAGLSNRQMVDRLEETGQVFQLTQEQESYLSDRGVDREVVTAMRDINQDEVRQAGYGNGNDENQNQRRSNRNNTNNDDEDVEVDMDISTDR